MFQIHLNIFITNNFLAVQINLHLNVGLDVSESSKLVEMPSESITSMI